MPKKSKSDVELGVHETLELHEILTLRRSTLLKGHMMESIVEDPELRRLLRKEKQVSEKAIDEIESLLP